MSICPVSFNLSITLSVFLPTASTKEELTFLQLKLPLIKGSFMFLSSTLFHIYTWRFIFLLFFLFDIAKLSSAFVLFLLVQRLLKIRLIANVVFDDELVQTSGVSLQLDLAWNNTLLKLTHAEKFVNRSYVDLLYL